MDYLSLFSGIGSCAVGLSPLGFKPVAFSEISSFASTVLTHHYPHVPNLGDIQKVDFTAYRGKIDLVIGGSPCQSFSLAGKHKGLNDSRGSLLFEYIRAINEAKPTWLIFENVPAFTKHISKFYSFLDSAYTLEYQILDASDFGIPQRRKRLFIVGYYGILSELTEKNERYQINSGEYSSFRLQDPIQSYIDAMDKVSENKQEASTQTIYALSQSFGFSTVSKLFPTQLNSRNIVYLFDGIHMRRATILELERAQGLPDNYTDVIWNNKRASYTARSSAIGNSFVPAIVNWIGQRILDLSNI